MKCKNCNATMEIDPSKQEAVCPYCGAKELICDSDAVAVEKSRAVLSRKWNMRIWKTSAGNRIILKKRKKERLILMGLLANLLLHLYLPAL